MRASSYIVHSKIPNSSQTIILHGYRGSVDIVDNTVAGFLLESKKQLKEPLLKAITPDAIEQLSSRGYLTDLSPEEEHALVIRIARGIHNATRLTNFAPMIIPTYSCNLRCFYCYQDHLHNENNKLYQLGRTNVITKEMTDAAFDAIEQLCPPKLKGAPLSLGLYGGEPFLAENRPIVEYIIRRSLERGYRLGAVTNASELHAYYDLLGPEGISGLQVTLDGIRSTHDCRRRYSGGEGTYDAIVANVTEALHCGARVSIRINVNRDNLQELVALTHAFVEYGWTKFSRFAAYVAPLYSAEVAPTKNPLSQNELADYLQKIRPDLSFPVTSSQKGSQTISLAQFFQKNTTGVGPFRTGVCSAVFGMYIFDPYGGIYACWDEAGNERHRIGTYSQGLLALKRDNHSAWTERSVAEVDQCSRCAYALVCGGGCAYLAAQEKGTYYASYCDHFQRNFRQTMVHTMVQLQSGKCKGGVCEPEHQESICL